MKKRAELILILVVCVLSSATVYKIRAKNEENNFETFFDSKIAGAITIQVNATTKTQPAGNLTVGLFLTPETGVYVENLMLNVYGFQNGTSPEVIGSILGQNITGGSTSTYDKTFPVPGDVWGVTFGNISLRYHVSVYPGTQLEVTSGFYMTNVENTFLKSLEVQLDSLNESYNMLKDAHYNLTNAYGQLNQTLVQLQQNYTTLQQNYTSLQGSMGQLENTREVVVVLSITTVFFVATTVFMVMRRPRENW